MDEKDPRPVSDLFASLNTVKIVMLLEREPLTDEFDQVMLTETQYLQVVRLIQGFMPTCNAGVPHMHMILERRHRVKIPNIRSNFGDDEVAAASKKIEH